MTNTISPARQLRELISQPGIIRSLGAHDVLTAVMIEQATIWNLHDKDGVYAGQAATFSHWRYL